MTKGVRIDGDYKQTNLQGVELPAPSPNGVPT